MNKYKILGLSIILLTVMIMIVSMAVIMPAIMTAQNFSSFIILCSMILFVIFLVAFIFLMINSGIYLIQKRDQHF